MRLVFIVKETYKVRRGAIQGYMESVAKLEDMLVMHCMTNAVLEYQIYLQILSTN